MSTIGFDTSNYTTSVSVCENGEVIQSRKLLKVKKGERGLRQSDALFQHVKQFSEVIKWLNVPKGITAIGVSTRPRSVEGSYMPVFLAGEAFAETAAAVLGVPIYKFSHQDGHIMAGIKSAEALELLDKDFISVHMSGGTTEILKTRYNGHGFDVEIVGGTKDISAGQVIDRVGVAFGMEFPCGKEMDGIACESRGFENLPVSVNGGYFNFSGLETKASGLISGDKSKVVSGVFLAISKTLEKAISNACSETGAEDVLLVGGVASSRFITDYLKNKLNCRLYVASPELSSDNACGIAILAQFSHDGR